jgi:hypothetical protein
MQIVFKRDELAFVFDKSMRVKSIIPLNECEFTVIFERCNDKTTPPIYETSYEKRERINIQTQTPTQKTDAPEHTQSNEIKFPSVEGVIEYIRSLDSYTYDNALVQEHFLGRVLDSRDEANLYHKLKDVINRAKERIQKEENGKWKEKGSRSLSKTRRAKQFTFVKPKITLHKNIQGENEVQFKDIMTKLSNGIKNELITIDKENENQH